MRVFVLTRDIEYDASVIILISTSIETLKSVAQKGVRKPLKWTEDTVSPVSLYANEDYDTYFTITEHELDES